MPPGGNENWLREGEASKERNKLNNLLSPLARVQFLSPTPQGSVSAESDICLFPLCLVGMVQGTIGDWVGSGLLKDCTMGTGEAEM